MGGAGAESWRRRPACGFKRIALAEVWHEFRSAHPQDTDACAQCDWELMQRSTHARNSAVSFLFAPLSAMAPAARDAGMPISRRLWKADATPCTALQSRARSQEVRHADLGDRAGATSLAMSPFRSAGPCQKGHVELRLLRQARQRWRPGDPFLLVHDKGQRCRRTCNGTDYALPLALLALSLCAAAFTAASPPPFPRTLPRPRCSAPAPLRWWAP